MGFTKLSERILQSSIMAEDGLTFKVWIALLAACESNGIAYVSPLFLASVCRSTIKRIEASLEKLEGPDPHSRSLGNEGRRINRIDGGYRVINYQIYREFSYSDSPEAIRQRRKRERDGSLHVTKGRDISASASASASSKGRIKGGISFDPSNRAWSGIEAADMEAWVRAYPACDINSELAKAGEWIIANPAKGKKSNYRRFIVNWLSRSQERGGGMASRRPDPTDSRVGANSKKDHDADYWTECRRLKALGVEGQALTDALAEWEKGKA